MLRDRSRDHECSGEIASLSNSERNLAIFTLPTARVRVAHDDVTTLAPYDLGLDSSSMMLLQRRIEAEADAPQQRCVRE